MSSPSNGLSMVLGIYRRVLRIHKQVLPPPIRPVGDRYAKEEFQQHLRRDLSVPQWQEFLSQWSQYCLMLEGKSEKRLGAGGISEEVLQSMSPEQKLQLERLKLEAQMLGSQLLKPDGSSK